MTEYQEKLLKTFKVFAQFCKDNDLTYYAAYGTCLGAVRHHGFIPWDDDLDVYMLRSDYDRMLSLRKQLKDTIYWISDYRDGDHPYSFAKFYSTDCSVWELQQFPFIIGPWVDIFPIDRWENNQEAERLYDKYCLSKWNYRKALSSQGWGEIIHDIIHFNGFNGLIKLVKKCFYSPFKSSFLKKALFYEDCIRDFKGSKLKAWTEVKEEVYEPEWFSQTLELPFEDITIPVPVGYKEYLTHRYGDYLQLPPEEKRVPHHNLFFVDLNKTLTIEQIKSNPSIILNERKPLSFKVLIDEIKHRKGFIHH